MHDANDVESLDDDFHSGETEDAPMDYYGDADDEADHFFEDADDSDRIESRRPEVAPLSVRNFAIFVLYNALFSWECCLFVPTGS